MLAASAANSAAKRSRAPREFGVDRPDRLRDAVAGHGGQPAVVPALEDPVPAGVGPGELHGRRHRLAAGSQETHHFGAGDDLDQRLGNLDLQAVWVAEDGPGVELGTHGGLDRRKPVPQRDRPEGATEIEVLVAIDVPDPPALAPFDEARFDPAQGFASGFGVRLRGHRNDLLRPLPQLPGTVHRPPRLSGHRQGLPARQSSTSGRPASVSRTRAEAESAVRRGRSPPFSIHGQGAAGRFFAAP